MPRAISAIRDINLLLHKVALNECFDVVDVKMGQTSLYSLLKMAPHSQRISFIHNLAKCCINSYTSAMMTCRFGSLEPYKRQTPLYQII